MMSQDSCVLKPEYIAPITKPEVDRAELRSARRELGGSRLQNERKMRFRRLRQITNSMELCKSLCRVEYNREVSYPPLEECKCEKLHSLEDLLREKEDLDGPCPNYEAYGWCRYGIKCKFSKNHTEVIMKKRPDGTEFPAEVKEKFKEGMKLEDFQKLSYQAVSRDFQKSLRSSDLNLQKAKNLGEWLRVAKLRRVLRNGPHRDTKDTKNVEKGLEKDVEKDLEKNFDVQKGNKPEGKEVHASDSKCQEEEILSRFPHDSITYELRPECRKRISMKGKLYLAPLTTLGNLPFRRLCKTLGADITCSEMAHSDRLLLGKDHEWALLRRHSSENIFGVQICGKLPLLMAECAEAISNSGLPIDFIDMNFGCPLNAVTRTGAGAAALDSKSRLYDICSAVSFVTDIPVTAKIRQGAYACKPVAHSLISLLGRAGVSVVSLHGRSKEQRYTKAADWEYISKCSAEAAKDSSGIELFGNGDVLSQSEYYTRLENDKNLSGVMIARGALIKPWIFTEIKERRDWDISSSERFEILKTLCNYGLEYWGSDSTGINTTRKFLCEWQSFMCRYVPLGLMEVLPQKMNSRVPKFIGRNDLETLLGSDQSKDWIKITEMLLGKPPEGFTFVPKYKSNCNDALNAEG